MLMESKYKAKYAVKTLNAEEIKIEIKMRCENVAYVSKIRSNKIKTFMESLDVLKLLILKPLTKDS